MITSLGICSPSTPSPFTPKSRDEPVSLFCTYDKFIGRDFINTCIKLNLKRPPDHCRFLCNFSCIWWGNVFGAGLGIRVADEPTPLYHGLYPVSRGWRPPAAYSLLPDCSTFGPRQYSALSALCTEQMARASLVAQTVKHLPAMWETWIQSLGWEDPLEKEMTTHSSTLAWKIPWTEEPGRLQSKGTQRVGRDWATSLPEVSSE